VLVAPDHDEWTTRAELHAALAAVDDGELIIVPGVSHQFLRHPAMAKQLLLALISALHGDRGLHQDPTWFDYRSCISLARQLRDTRHDMTAR
jgi:hypothetical protein